MYRSSEVYERVKDDIEITNAHVIVDFHQRKKHGETVPPFEIPRKFYGVEEYLVPYILKRSIVNERQNGFLLASAAQQLGEYARKSWVKSSILIISDLKLSKKGMNREKGSITHLKAVSESRA